MILTGPPFLVDDRGVRTLDPDLAAAFADSSVLPGLTLTATQLGPKLFVVIALSIAIFDEHAMMLPLDLVQRVTHRLQEVLVGGHNRAVELKLDDGLRFVDGGELPAQVRQDPSRIRLS